MSEQLHPVLKKLNYKEAGQPVLVMNAPFSYKEVTDTFEGEVHTEPKAERYGFVQVFGTNNEEIQKLGRQGVTVLEEDGLLWLCYPKKSSKAYKGVDCSRESVAALLGDEGYEPVRQIAIDEDWSALRLRKVEHIKTMTRKSAWTAKGQERVEGSRNDGK